MSKNTDRIRLQELAGIINENEFNKYLPVKSMRDIIIGMAEKRAYDENSEGGLNVTHDQILSHAEELLDLLSKIIKRKLQEDFQK